MSPGYWRNRLPGLYEETSWKCRTLLFSPLILILITPTHAGISYQSVSFVHGPSKVRQFHPLSRPPSAPSFAQAPSIAQAPHFPTVKFYENHIQHSYAEELWPTSIFDEPVDFLDISLNDHEHVLHTHQHEHDFINELELPPDPYLLTGYRAKQAANYLYSHELFYKDIPHAKALLKLQDKRIANGLRPNRLGSINVRSPFNREPSKRY